MNIDEAITKTLQSIESIDQTDDTVDGFCTLVRNRMRDLRVDQKGK